MRYLLTALLLLTPTIASAQSVAFMGDSDFDEYRGSDGRCRTTAYASTTLNPVELFALRGGNVGAWAAWGGVRRTGYGLDFARSGAKSYQVLSQGQHTLAAAAYPDVAILKIGANDLKPGISLYESIYAGTVSASSLTKALNKIVADQVTAIRTVTATGAQGWVFTWAPPRTDASHQNPQGQARLQAAVNAINQGLAQAAELYGFGLVDFAGIQTRLTALGYAQPDGTLRVGGVTLTLSASCEPHSLLTADGHAGTVLSGLVLNLLLETTGLAPTLTDGEIMALAGL